MEVLFIPLTVFLVAILIAFYVDQKSKKSIILYEGFAKEVGALLDESSHTRAFRFVMLMMLYTSNEANALPNVLIPLVTKKVSKDKELRERLENDINDSLSLEEKHIVFRMFVKHWLRVNYITGFHWYALIVPILLVISPFIILLVKIKSKSNTEDRIGDIFLSRMPI